MIFIYGIILSLIVLIFTYYWNRRKLLIASWKLPGPFALPIVGNAFVIRNPFEFIDIVKKSRDKYGNIFRLWFGPNLMIFCSVPKYVGTILTTDETRDKGKSYSQLKHATRGDGLFTKQDDAGKITRKLLNPTVQHPKMLTKFYPIFNKQLSIFEQILNTHVDKGEFDISMMIFQLALDITTETTFGTELNTQTEKNIQLLSSGLTMFKIVGLRILQPWLQIPFIFKLTKWHKIYNEASNIGITAVNKMIEKRIEIYYKNHENQNNSALDGEKTTSIFVDKIINITLEEKLLPVSDIQSESLTILLAGFETSAITTTFIALALAMYPDYQEKIYEEIMSILPDKTATVTNDDITKLELGDRFIKETLRLFPPGPIISRSVKSDFKIDDINIPAGADVLIPIILLHKDKEIWGPNAEQFNPDNFLPENYAKIPPYAYIPFSAGSRNCIGYKYANIFMRVFLFYLVRNHRLTTNIKMEDLKYSFNITLKLLNTPVVMVHKRT